MPTFREKKSTELKLTPIVKSMIGIHITGNITPPTWYTYVIKPRSPKAKKNKPDLIGIAILSDVWYWYTPTEIRDERTGLVIGHKDKFQADMLQKTYQSYMDMYSLGWKQVKSAVDNLIRLNLIRRNIRDIITSEGITLTGVVFLEPIVENILKITYPERYNYNINILEDPLPKKEGGGSKKGTPPPLKKEPIQRLQQRIQQRLQQPCCRRFLHLYQKKQLRRSLYAIKNLKVF